MKPFTNLMFDTYSTHKQLESGLHSNRENMDLSAYMSSCGLNASSLEKTKDEYDKFVSIESNVELVCSYKNILKQ